MASQSFAGSPQAPFLIQDRLVIAADRAVPLSKEVSKQFKRCCSSFGSCITICPNNAVGLELRKVEEFDSSILKEITLRK